MKTLLHITAQVHENGKPKGGQVFSLNVDSDAFMYAKDECINAIKILLEKRSNNYCKFTYVDHELIFMGIEALNDDEFETALVATCEEEHKAMTRYENGMGTD
jgi:hypothetical protein